MKKEINEITSSDSFKEKLKNIKKKLGKEMLNDDDLFIMACEKLLRTYTFDEKGYR